jgi:hypothetical protein
VGQEIPVIPPAGFKLETIVQPPWALAVGASVYRMLPEPSTATHRVVLGQEIPRTPGDPLKLPAPASIELSTVHSSLFSACPTGFVDSMMLPSLSTPRQRLVLGQESDVIAGLARPVSG